MKNLQPYLSFEGTCEEALHFYADSLGGEIVSVQRFGEGPMDVPEEAKNKVMHAVFKAGEINFMASDTMPSGDYPHVVGTNVTLSIDFDDEAKQTAVFDKLAAGGNVMMPLHDAFWGGRFGMLSDKYGVNWMFSYGTSMSAS